MSPAARPKVVPVIMSGGSGTRLWPLSTESAPKQFHALASDRTMFQDTLTRVTGGEAVDFLPAVAISNIRHRDLVAEQFQQLGLEMSAIVLEPFGRNTAAVAAIAAELVARLHPGALALLLPADHVVADDAGFQAAVARGAAVADTHIVTFGVKTTRPETGFGYLRRGEPLADEVFKVAEFAEKPSAEVAESYFANSAYSWNGGIFLFSPDVLLREMRLFRPDIAQASTAALDKAHREGPFLLLDVAEFADCPSDSVDYAVMERTDWSAMTPVDVGWADIGSWSELWRMRPHDEGGNALHGETVALEASGSLIWSEPGVTVVAMGVHDLIIVATGDAVIVLPKDRAQDLKAIVTQVAAQRRTPPV